MSPIISIVMIKELLLNYSNDNFQINNWEKSTNNNCIYDIGTIWSTICDKYHILGYEKNLDPNKYVTGIIDAK